MEFDTCYLFFLVNERKQVLLLLFFSKDRNRKQKGKERFLLCDVFKRDVNF